MVHSCKSEWIMAHVRHQQCWQSSISLLSLTMKKIFTLLTLLVNVFLLAENIYAPGYRKDFEIGDVHYIFEKDDFFHGDFHLDLIAKDGSRKMVWQPKGDGSGWSGTGQNVLFHIYASGIADNQKAYMATSRDIENPLMELAEISKDGVKLWDYCLGAKPDRKIERIVFGKDGALLMLPENNGDVNLAGGGIRVFANDHVLETGRAAYLKNYLHTPPGLCDAIERLRMDDKFLSDYATVGKDEYSEKIGESPLNTVLYKYIYCKYIHSELQGVVPPMEKIDEILSKVIAKDEVNVSDEELSRIAETLRPLLHKDVKYIDKKYSEWIPGSETYYGLVHWRQKTLLRNMIALIHHYSCDELLTKPLDIKIVDKRRKMAWEIEAMEKEKRRFRSVKTLFTEEETNKVFTEPNPADFKDGLSLARAYNFSGNYVKAMETYRKCDSLQARFELGCMLKTGRPGIAAAPDEADIIFKEIEEDVSVMQEPSSELLCLAGCAVLERHSDKWDVMEKLRRTGKKYLDRAVAGGNADAMFFFCYYKVNSVYYEHFSEVERNAVSQEVKINVKLYYNSRVEHGFMDREEERDFCRQAIFNGHSVSALCWLGECYLGRTYDDKGHQVEYGRPIVEQDMEKARFWISKAAERGFMRANWLLDKYFKGK